MTTPSPKAPVLQVKDLQVQFATNDGPVFAVNGVSFDLARGQTLGIVGESGSGKSQTALAMMGLLARQGQASGQVLYQGQNLLTLAPDALNTLRGAHIAMVFQDPMTALNPYLTVERQMTEVLQWHKGLDRKAARQRALAMLDAVKIPDAAGRISRYPHEFSGGMRQRVMLAMSLLCEPEILLADEPTTALDVTVQAQILALLRELQRDLGTAVVLITHDLGVVAGVCDQVLVMYGGRVMEQGSVEHIFARAAHPYTRGLLQAIPRMDGEASSLRAIPGTPPLMAQLPSGCPFAPRCGLADAQCSQEVPQLQVIDASAAANAPFVARRACHRSEAQVLHHEAREASHG